MALILESSAFEDGAEIPARYTCKGDDVSSPLRRKPGNRPLLFSREPLIKSGSNKLSVKMFWFKAWNARNSRAIAKFCNAETGRFNHKMSIHDLIRGSLKLFYL
jgi:hypothetical protein